MRIDQFVKNDQGKIVGHLLTHEEYMELLKVYVSRDFSMDEHRQTLRDIESGEADKTSKTSAEMLEMLKKLDEELTAGGL